MFNPYYFTNRNLKVGFNITLESHHINYANSKLIVKPKCPEFGIEVRSNNKIVRELSVIYARTMNQYTFKNQTLFSARFDKQDENNQVLDETEFFINININHNLFQTDIDNVDVESALEHQIQQQEMKDSGRRFDKIISKKVSFYKTGELNGSNYIKIHLRRSAILNIENNDKNCFLRSTLTYLNPCNNIPPYRFQYINKISMN